MAKITSKNIEDNIEFTTNPKFASDPTVDNDLSRKAYVDSQDALKLALAGDTMSGEIAMGSNKITGLADGTAPGDAVNKGQFDAGLEGLNPKPTVRVATISVLPETMTADDVAPTTGNRSYDTTALTISWFASEGPTTIDGVTLANGNRILVKDESATSGPSAGEGRKYNGIYERTSLDVWTRIAEMNISAEVKGAYVPVQEGSAPNLGKFFVQFGAFTTLDTDNILFTFFNSALATHDHTASEITDFDTEVSNNSSVTTNTAKVSADGLVTTHSDVSDAGSGIIISDAERTKLSNIEASAQVNVALASQAEAEAGVEATKTMTALRVKEAIAALETATPTNGREVITLVAQDITNGYVEAAEPVNANSLTVTPIGGIPQEPGVDFTESIVVTNTRITFAGDLLGLVATEKLLIEYTF